MLKEQVRPPIVDIRDTTWWQRNWKWAVPGLVVGGVSLMVTLGVAIIMLVLTMMKSSDAYKDALARAQADPRVQTAIGTPIEDGWYVIGNINVSGGTGNADLSIPISGPLGSATIWLDARKSQGTWTFSTLLVEIDDTGEDIDLLE